MLLAGDGDPAEIVHHAEEAGDEDVVAEYALVAARRASALDSNREAYSHFARAAEFADRLPQVQQAALAEELAQAAYDGQPPRGRIRGHGARHRAPPGARRQLAVGRCTRILSRFHWYAGRRGTARRTARAAVAILEREGESVELARAYSGLSQLAMLAEQREEAIAWGGRALALATRLGDESTRAHALINVGSARIEVDPAAKRPLSSRGTRSRTPPATATRRRARCSTSATTSCAGRPPSRRSASARTGLAYAREHEVHTLASYAASMVAWLQLRAGAGTRLSAPPAPSSGRRRPCRGCSPRRWCASSPSGAATPTRADRLADLVARADRAAELQRIVPALALAIEWSLTRGGPLPLERLRRVIGEIDWDGATRLRCAAGGRLGRGRGAATWPGQDRPRHPTPRCCGATGRPRPTPSGTSAGTTTGR